MKPVDVRVEVSDLVYPPSEDTFLLADALEVEENDEVLEVGCGSGYVSICAATVAKRVVASDISFEAVRDTVRNARANGVEDHLTVLQSDLLTSLHPSARFDIIAFNPPYLPADQTQTTLDQALIGGEYGVEIAEKFIHQAVGHLRQSGRIYIVMSTRCDCARLERLMVAQGLDVDKVISRKFFYEELYVLCGTQD